MTILKLLAFGDTGGFRSFILFFGFWEGGVDVETLEDLAKRLKVSRRTVSRVLTNDKNVALATRKKIQSFLKGTDFVPNEQAARLAGRRVPVVGLVFPESFLPTLDDYVAQVIRGVLGVAHQKKHQVTFYAFRSLDVTEVLRLYRGKMVGGFIFVAFGEGDFNALQNLKRKGVPFVNVGLLCPGVYSVDCDNEKGGFLATEHLVSSGRRRVAFLHGDPSWSSSRERFKGYQRALKEAGVPFRSEFVQTAYYSDTAAHQTVLKLFSTLPRPDALFAANDLMSIGAYAAFRELKIKVPRDVSLIGFDDNPVCSMPILETTLSSVHQPMREMASAATDVLLTLMEGEEQGALFHRLFEPRLVVRQSSSFS